MSVVTALLFYAVCAGFLQAINVDKDAAICISESVSWISGIASYVEQHFGWLETYKILHRFYIGQIPFNYRKILGRIIVKSDYTKSIAFTQKKLYKSKEKFSKKATAEARLIYEATLEIVECTVSCFTHGDEEMAFHIDSLADVISRAKKDIQKNHSKRLEKGRRFVELGLTLTDMITSLERIAKHCSNIVEEPSGADQHALHQYARNVKERNRLMKW